MIKTKFLAILTKHVKDSGKNISERRFIFRYDNDPRNKIAENLAQIQYQYLCLACIKFIHVSKRKTCGLQHSFKKTFKFIGVRKGLLSKK